MNSEAAFFEARRQFLARADVGAELRRALGTVSERGTALRLLLVVDLSLIIELTAELVRVASVGHADVGLARQVLGRLPPEWREAHLWPYIEPVLRAGDSEEYRRVAELLHDLESRHLETLVAMALESEDEDTREVGWDFS